MSDFERVRVIARIRPFTSADPDDALLSTVVVDDHHVTVDSKFSYAVDHAYQMETQTEDIFKEVLQPLLNDFLSGYNITLMAYGQTGTGKTYTMSGLTPLAINHIVQVGFRGNVEELSFQFIEVYGDTIRDLLAEDPIESSKHLQLFDGAKGEGGETLLTGAVRIRAVSLHQITELIEYGTMMRATGATSISEASSRSHSIFTVFNHRDNSKLHLVDLAGSERVKKTKNVGQRFQESIAINTGLLALGNVIRALRKNHQSQSAKNHVPYRSSKLTRLLQDSLGGNSRTVFIACIAPDHYNQEETKRTLEYSTIAQRVVNNPVAHYDAVQEEPADGGMRTGGAGDNGRRGGSVSQQEYQAVLAFSKAKEKRVQQLEDELREVRAREKKLAKELRNDESIFKRQILEIQRLVSENAKLQRRVQYLEDQGIEAQGVEASTPTEGVSLVKKIMRMHGFTDSNMKDESGVDYAPSSSPAPNRKHRLGSAFEHSHNAETLDQKLGPHGSERGAAVEPITKVSRSPPVFPLSLSPEAQHPYLVSGDAPAAPPPTCGGPPALLADEVQEVETGSLVKRVFGYQRENAELRGKMSTLEAILEEQRRETAMLRVGAQQWQQAQGIRPMQPS